MSENKAYRSFETFCLGLFGLAAGAVLGGYLPDIWAPQWLTMFDSMPDHTRYWSGIVGGVLLLSSMLLVLREHVDGTNTAITLFNILGALGILASLGADAPAPVVGVFGAFLVCRTLSLILNRNWKL